MVVGTIGHGYRYAALAISRWFWVCRLMQDLSINGGTMILNEILRRIPAFSSIVKFADATAHVQFSL